MVTTDSQQEQVNIKVECATYSTEELATLIGKSLVTTYEYLNQGLIPAHRLGRHWIISKKQADEWLENAPAVPVTMRRMIKNHNKSK